MVDLDNYLNGYGHNYDGWNNKLLQFNFVTKEWTNMKCLGEVPIPCGKHVTTIIGNTVWLTGGYEVHVKMDG